MGRVRIIALALLLFATGCSGAENQDQAAVPVALVQLGRVEQGSIQETVTVYGSADSGAGVNAVLSAPAEGLVEAIVAPVGTPVRPGQVVVRLRPSPTVQLDLARASTDARTTQLALARAQRLRADGLVGNAEVESARAAARTASATLASLNARSRSFDLRTPVAGFVQTISSTPGDLVASGGSVATVARAGDLRGRFGIDPALARRIPQGASVQVAPSAGGAPVGLPVLSVDPSIDAQTRLASLYVRIPQATGIGAGETLTGELLVHAAYNAITMPYAALLDDGGQPFAYVVVNKVARRRDLTVGSASGGRLQVLRGLRPGELVVTAGATALEDGMKVRTR